MLLKLGLAGLVAQTWASTAAHAQPSLPADAPPDTPTESGPTEASAPKELQAPVGAARASADGLVSAFLALGYAYSDSGFGMGMRYQRIVAPVGVIKSDTTHDEIGIEGGLDYYRYNFRYAFGPISDSIVYNEVAITVGATWNFWFLKEKLSLYPKIDLSYRVGNFSGESGAMSGYGGIWIQGAAGVIYRTSGVSLRAELGSGSLHLGAGFSFF